MWGKQLTSFPAIELAHTVSGPEDGQTVVLLHGLSNSSQTYFRVAPWVAARGWQVVLPDLRGHGESPWANSYRTDDYAEDVAGLIESLGRGAVVVVGHSLGGVVASTLAAEYPDLVRGIFLEDPPLFQADPDIRQADRSIQEFPAIAAQIRRWQNEGTSEEEVMGEYGAQPSPYPGETVREIYGDDRLRERVRALLQCDPTAINAGFTGELWEGHDPTAPMACPVTVLAADPSLDAMFLPEHFAWYTDAMPQAQIVSVEGSAHSIHHERGGLEAYLDSLDRFLDSL